MGCTLAACAPGVPRPSVVQEGKCAAAGLQGCRPAAGQLQGRSFLQNRFHLPSGPIPHCFTTLLYQTALPHCFTTLLVHTVSPYYFTTLLRHTALPHCFTTQLYHTTFLLFCFTLLVSPNVYCNSAIETFLTPTENLLPNNHYDCCA